jgi:Regulator of chromosome condensation (RCC1) repeat
VLGLAGVTQVAGGGCGHSLALRSDGTVWAWGNDTLGRLGNAPASSSVTRPVNTIGAGSAITQISAGLVNVVALKGLPLSRGNPELCITITTGRMRMTAKQTLIRNKPES